MAEEETQQETAAPAATEGGGEQKAKKINRMSPAELKAALEKTEKHMNGTQSRYAWQLKKRLAELES